MDNPLLFSTNAMNTSESVIESCTVERNESLDIPECIHEQSRNFALLKLKTKKVAMTKKPTFLLFTVDKTGSMQEYGGPSGTKLSYVKHTFKNMIRYLSGVKESEIYIRVHVFDESVEVLIDDVRVTPDNMNVLIEKVDKLTGDGLTSIDKALNAANTAILEHTRQFPDHQLGHIFMTDGEPSSGVMNETDLADMVDDTFTNIFVGFGNGHNVSLLRRMSDRKFGDYQYVDSPESTVLIYGETIHRFLYPAIRNVRIVVRNGLIYDWKTNLWVNEMEEDVIIGDIEKVYHIREDEDSLYDAEVEVYGVLDTEPAEQVLCATAYSMPNLSDASGNMITPRDFTTYVFRQKVLEFMYAIKKNDMAFAEKKNLKTKLKEFFREMRIFMKDRNKIGDSLMQTLCDDIYILYHTLGKRDGLMYTLGRQYTHGKQKVFSPTSSSQPIFRSDAMDEFDNSPPPTPRFGPGHNPPPTPRPRLARLPTSPIDGFTSPFPDIPENEAIEDADPVDDDENIDMYTVTDESNKSCYSTPGVLDTVYTMSQSE